VAIAKTEPGDENNQDISSLVGKVDIRKLEYFSQNDPDAYSYSGGLNRANQGLLEFVEMFKAPIKMLHPLLTATQEGNYIGTETSAPSPSPASSWLLQRGRVADLPQQQEQRSLHRPDLRDQGPYCLRAAEEQKIYEKLISSSELAEAPCAAGHPGDAGPVLGADAAAPARQLDYLRPSCGSMTARA